MNKMYGRESFQKAHTEKEKIEYKEKKITP